MYLPSEEFQLDVISFFFDKVNNDRRDVVKNVLLMASATHNNGNHYDIMLSAVILLLT